MEKKLTRAESARINGAKSRGPVTPAGKARSSQNARKKPLPAPELPHGDHIVVLSNEDIQLYDQLVEQHFQRFQPVDPVERRIVEDIAAIEWRLEREQAIQTRLIEGQMLQERTHDPIPELNRVATAELSLLSKSSFLQQVRVISQLIRARNHLIATLASMRKNFELPGQIDNVIEFTPDKRKNEPKTNPKRTQNEPKQPQTNPKLICIRPTPPEDQPNSRPLDPRCPESA
jgi:hypothetical protein